MKTIPSVIKHSQFVVSMHPSLGQSILLTLNKFCRSALLRLPSSVLEYLRSFMFCLSYVDVWPRVEVMLMVARCLTLARLSVYL